MTRRDEVWIFDLDGTLTVAQHDFDGFRRRVGLPEGLPLLEAIALRPAEERPALLDAVHRWEADLADEAVASPGARALLEQLTGSGVPVGILTRNSRATARRTLAAAGLDRYFAEAVVLGRDEATPKPSPDGVLRLLAGWGAHPSRGVMVGDWRFDLEAARGAGVRAIWLDLERSGAFADLADRVIFGLEELLEG